jgi:hypothetical protein
MAQQKYQNDVIKRGRIEKMQQLAEKMHPTGRITDYAEWDDDLGVMLFRLAESKAVVIYGTIKGFDIHVRPVKSEDEGSASSGPEEESIFSGDTRGISRTICIYTDFPEYEMLTLPYNRSLSEKLMDIMDDLDHYRDLARSMKLLDEFEYRTTEAGSEEPYAGAFSPEALESSLDDDDEGLEQPDDSDHQFRREDLDIRLFDT